MARPTSFSFSYHSAESWMGRTPATRDGHGQHQWCYDNNGHACALGRIQASSSGGSARELEVPIRTMWRYPACHRRNNPSEWSASSYTTFHANPCQTGYYNTPLEPTGLLCRLPRPPSRKYLHRSPCLCSINGDQLQTPQWRGITHRSRWRGSHFRRAASACKGCVFGQLHTAIPQDGELGCKAI